MAKTATALKTTNPPTEPKAIADAVVIVKVPVAPPPTGAYREYMHVNLQLLTTTQRRGLQRLVDGLDHQKATLASAKRVVGPTDAIRWMLEQLA